MAGINLIPDPTIMAVQAGVFLTAVYTVKKLFISPYLQLREKRTNATVNQKDRAKDLLLANEELSSTIQAKFSDARDEIHAKVSEKREEANAQREAILSAADQEAKIILNKVREEIQKALAEERHKMTQIVPALTQELYSKTLN